MVKRLYAETSGVVNTNYGRLKKVKSVHGPNKVSQKKKMINLIKKVTKQVAEHKEVINGAADGTLTFTSATSSIQLLNSVGEGSDYNQRIGRSINHSYVEVNIEIHSISDGSANNFTAMDAGFWALVYDRQTNGAVAAFTDMFDTSAGSGVTGLAFRNTATFQDRFKIIRREEWAVGAVSNSASTNPSGAVPYHIKVYVDLAKEMRGRDANTKFSTNAAGIAAIEEGALYLVFANTLANAHLTTHFNYQSKYRFTDM